MNLDTNDRTQDTTLIDISPAVVAADEIAVPPKAARTESVYSRFLYHSASAQLRARTNGGK